MQLSKELRKGRAFDGWSEGTLSFAPTYKYEFNSESYSGEDPKAGRRTPAWYASFSSKFYFFTHNMVLMFLIYVVFRLMHGQVVMHFLILCLSGISLLCTSHIFLVILCIEGFEELFFLSMHTFMNLLAISEQPE